MVQSNNFLANPEVVEKSSFLLAFLISFVVLLNSHTFYNLASAASTRAAMHNIEAKAQHVLDLGLTEDVVKPQQAKDLDNSFAE